MVRKVAMPEPTVVVIREASSPSSGDAVETSGEAIMSRRKRPLEPADDSKAAPPTKRERKESDPPVHEVARAAWAALVKKEPDRPDFRKDELFTMFNDECMRLRLSGRANQRLKRQLGKFLSPQGMFHKSERPGAPQESYILVNPEYKHVRSRDAQRKNDPGKKGDQGSGGSNDDDAVMQEAPNRATVPTEWTEEAYKPVRLSPFDKSHRITFVGENTVIGLKGYRMIRATNGVSEGDWYFECTVLPFQQGAVRLGWSMRRCDVETPVGFDAYGFGLRDRSGEFVHMARRKPYGEPFTVGDVIGCRIVLPELTDEEKKAVADAEDRWLQHRFVSFGQGQAPADSGIDITFRAKIEFFKNGKSMGIPALFNTPPPPPPEVPTEERNVEVSNGSAKSKESVKTTVQTEGEIKKCMKAGVYYPTVALFQEAKVQANFGPIFKHDLPEGSLPLCESARDKPVVEIPVEKPTDDALKAMEGEGKSAEASMLYADEAKQCEEKANELGKDAIVLKESDEKPAEGPKQAMNGELLKQDGEHPIVHLATAVEKSGKRGDSIEAVGNVETNASDGKDSVESTEGSAVEKASVPVA